MFRSIALAALAGSAALAATPAFAVSPLEVRFCPDKVARTYPLMDVARIQGLVLHNVAVINRGAAPVTLKSIEVELLDKGQAIDARRFEGPGLEAAAKGAAKTKASGMMEMFPFQFCGERLLDAKTALSDDAVLAPGEAVLVMRQMFAWRGSRDQVRVEAKGEAGGAAVEASAAIPIDGTGTKTRMRFPLKGRSMVVVAATPQGGHRWLIPEEFALDIVTFGGDTKSYRTTGAAFADFYAYGIPVRSVADGVVVTAHEGEPENVAALRRPDETVEAYGGRVQEIQMGLIQKGIDAIAGNHVIVDHGNGEYSIYAHLKPGSLKVKVGQAVKAGDQIGSLGSSGNSTEPHLHFAVCDAPSALACAGIPANFTGIELPYADSPRAVQAGDVVLAD
jgi:murein DD-endopeptidase MepM/ murein hydrolase activator NlpD